MSQRKLIVGNWKMNGLVHDSIDRANTLSGKVKEYAGKETFDLVLCPPATVLSLVGTALSSSPIALGGQDSHEKESGAYTGNVSAAMLKDIGCHYVILGHSERRQYHAETNALVGAKAQAAHAAGIISIICVGETDAERTAGTADNVVLEQLTQSIPASASPENTVIAYEPVWAIGTGKTPSADDIKNMHAVIRNKVGAGYKLLYGGSVKASNAAEILSTANVDGVLVGGASLKTDEFWGIATASPT